MRLFIRTNRRRKRIDLVPVFGENGEKPCLNTEITYRSSLIVFS